MLKLLDFSVDSSIIENESRFHLGRLSYERQKMREFLKTKGFKMTPQRELIFRSFFEMEKHVSVDELYDRVRQEDKSVGYSTVWRNLKLICKVGLAEEVNLGDGVTRYDRVTEIPHGHLYCLECRELEEFEVDVIVDMLTGVAAKKKFIPEVYKIEIQGLCKKCKKAPRKPVAVTQVN